MVLDCKSAEEVNVPSMKPPKQTAVALRYDKPSNPSPDRGR